MKMESNLVNEESEDLLSQTIEEKQNDNKEEKTNEGKDEEKEEEGKEISAANALTSLNDGNENATDEEAKDIDEDDGEEDDDDDSPADDTDFKIPLKLTKSGRRRATPFPLKVCKWTRLVRCRTRLVMLTHLSSLTFHQLMKVLSNKEFSDIIAWTPSGKAFNIIQPKMFTSQILPSHFKQAKYSSFTRKLHRWGFMRHYRGPEAGAFFHKHFRRGRMDLVEKMTCSKPGAPQTSKASGPRATAAENDRAPAMNMIMDTSASSRDSGSYGPGSNLMGGMMGHPLGLPQLPPGSQGFNALMQQQQAGMPQQLLMQSFGGMSPAQQQIFLQQQQQFQHQQAMAAQAGSPAGEAGLDAAIEMEVNRRLKERINAAAFSRQALSMMQQQQPTQGPNQGQQAMVQQSMMGGRSMFAAGMGSPTLQGFPQGFKGFDHQGLSFGVNMPDHFGMPSNIQGAKTA